VPAVELVQAGAIRDEPVRRRRDTSEHLAAAQRAFLTYPDVAATRWREPPVGYALLRRRFMIGVGSGCFEACSRALFSWRMHEGAGFGVTASSPHVVTGDVAVLAAGNGLARVLVPVRVVYTVLERDRLGFAYGTLPGHPFAGEELFVLERDADGRTYLAITAFSRAATWLARMLGPVRHPAQRVIAARYAASLRRALRDSPDPFGPPR
jgi:uncharacterized protein (UPF0548 family)